MRSLQDIVDVPGPWEHRRVTANGARFHVAVVGQGPLVLFLHGFPEFWWAWRHQLGPVASAGYQAVAMDLRGYGGSDKTPRGYDPFTTARDVAGVIRGLGHSSAVLVGHGWGGYQSWGTAGLTPRFVDAIAVISMAHPRRIRQSLRSASQIRAARHVLGYQMPLMPENRLIADDAAEVERILRSWSAPGSAFPDEEASRRYRDAMSIWPAPHCALEYHRWAIRSLTRTDGRSFARRMSDPVAMPTLLVHGEQDGRVLERTVRGSEDFVEGPFCFTSIAGSGHFPHEEKPAETTALLLEWLGSTVTSVRP
jgi:pimeloyl-ACP methyl ester carboxylesterase